MRTIIRRTSATNIVKTPNSNQCIWLENLSEHKDNADCRECKAGSNPPYSEASRVAAPPPRTRDGAAARGYNRERRSAISR